MNWLVGLNALRLFAMLLIVVYHFFRGFLPGGFVAVEIFFGISGFLIVGKLLREYMSSRRIAYGRFLKERFVRIFPPLAIAVVLTVVFSFAIGSNVLVKLPQRALAALTFSTNYYELASGGGYENTFAPSLFEHTWFVALEMQLYIITPLIILAVMKKRKKPRAAAKQLGDILLAVGFLSLALMVIHGGLFGDYNRAYLSIDTHMGAFCLGGALAAYYYLVGRALRTRKTLPAIGLVFALVNIVYLAFSFNYNNPVSFIFALPYTAILTPLLIICIILLQANFGKKKGSNRLVAFLDYLGSYTYGIYLFHFPLYLLCGHLLPSDWPVWSHAIVAIIASIILVISSDRVIKNVKFLRINRLRRNRKKLIAAYSAATVALVILAVVRLANVPASSNITEQLATQDTVEYLDTDFEYFDFQKVANRTDEILNLELSTAATLEASQLNVHANNRSIEGAEVLMIGDSVMLGAKDAIETKMPYAFVDAQECRGIEAATGIISHYAAAGHLPDTIVISLITNDRYISAETFDAIQNAGGWDKTYILMTGYAGPLQPREWHNGIIRDYVNSHANVYLADWYPIAINNWYLMYDDHIHLNPEGRIVYANLLEQTLKEARP